MQGSFRIGLIPHLSFAVLIIVGCRCLRLLLDWLGGVVVCVCCRIGCSVCLFAFVVVFVGWCCYLRLLSDLLGGADVSAVGTTLLQSLGWNERPLGRSPKGQVKLVLLWGFAECGNRKALRLKAQGVYSCK